MTTSNDVDTTANDVDRLVETAIGLGDQVEQLQAQLQEKLGIATVVGGLETRTAKIQKLQDRLKNWGKVVVVGLILDILLSIGLGAVALNAKTASDRGQTAIKQGNVTEQQLCAATQRSWDTRKSLAIILTKPTVLSPEIERLFPSDQVESLRIQIAASNKIRAGQRKQLLDSNGPRPVCEE